MEIALIRDQRPPPDQYSPEKLLATTEQLQVKPKKGISSPEIYTSKLFSLNKKDNDYR